LEYPRKTFFDLQMVEERFTTKGWYDSRTCLTLGGTLYIRLRLY
jgi:hypothetical protein